MKKRLTRAGVMAIILATGGATADESAVPTVNGLLQAMAKTLADAQQFTVRAEKTFEDVLITGSRVEYEGAIDLAVKRPDRAYMSYGDDLTAKEAWFDGEHLVLVSHTDRVHGSIEAMGGLHSTLDGVAKRYDLRMPLAELISPALFETLSEKVESASYLGVHRAGGARSHHLLLRGQGMEAQLWIDAGDRPLLNKLVVTEMDEPGQPQSMFLFSGWDLAAEFADDTFTPEVPDGYVRAEFLQVRR